MTEISVDSITRICDWSLCHGHNVSPDTIRNYFVTRNITVNPKSPLGLRMQLFDLYASPDIDKFDSFMTCIYLNAQEIHCWMEISHKPVAEWAAFLIEWENRVIPRPKDDVMELLESIPVKLVDRPSRNSIIFSRPDPKYVSQVIFDEDEDDDEISTPPSSIPPPPQDDDPFMDNIPCDKYCQQSKKPRKYEHWTYTEDQALFKGLMRYGNTKWSKIMSDAELKPILHRRNATKLKDRVRNLEKAGKLPAHLVNK
jgi:hypothetical protein